MNLEDQRYIVAIKWSALLVLLLQPLFVLLGDTSRIPWILVLPGPTAGLIFLLGVRTPRAAWIGGSSVLLLVGVGWIAFLTANPGYVEEEAMTFLYVVVGNLAGAALAILTSFVDMGYRTLRRFTRPRNP